MREKSLFQIACFGFILLIFAACRPEKILPGSTEIKATITQSTFRPAYWRVSGGAKISVTLINQDPVPHYWTVLRDPITLPNQTNRHYAVFYQTKVGSAETKTTQFTAPLAPGEYDVVGDPPFTDDTGIVGTLLVVQP
jgi:plastocyanin